MTRESPTQKYITRASRRKQENEGTVEKTVEEIETSNEDEIIKMAQENIGAVMDHQPSRNPKKIKVFQLSLQCTNATGSRRAMMTKDVLESIEVEEVEITDENENIGLF